MPSMGKCYGKSRIQRPIATMTLVLPWPSLERISWLARNDDGSTYDRGSVRIFDSNKPPIVTAGSAVNYTAGATGVVVTPTGTVTDADSPNFAAGSLTVSIATNVQTNDRLEIRNQGLGAGQIGVSGNRITFGGLLIGTFSGGAGSTPLVIMLRGGATVSATQALLRNITFRTIGATPSTAAHTIRFVLADGDGGRSTAANATVNFN